MLNNIRTGIFAIATLFITAIVNAQQPAPPKALTDLMRLEGKWQGPATLNIDGKMYKFTYYADFKKTADGTGMYMDEWFSAPELGNMKGANLVGYNTNDSKVHWFSVDNFGTTHDHPGMWKSANHFFMQANEMQGKKKFIEKIDLNFKGDDTMDLLLVATLDGKEIERGTATFTRTK